MNVQPSHKLSTFVAALLAIFAFPALICAQTASTTTTPAKKPPATRPKAPVPVAQVATTNASSGTLTCGNVIYTPAGCVHNGTKAVCTFTLVNQGNAVTLQAPWQMNTLQFVDDAHVPHIADAAYFVDNYGTRQAQLFVNNGQGGTLVREFPNVNDQVANGEFHLANQVVGGVGVGAAGTIPTQGTAVTNTPVQRVANAPIQPIQPIAANTPTTPADPTGQVQNGINQVNAKKQKVKSIRDQMKSIWK